MRPCRSFFLLALLMLSSCGVQSFRSDFIGYNKAYAGMLNEQMLLNLARLDNGHPPYFMVPGAIDTKYDFTQEAATNGTRSDTDGSSAINTSNTNGGILGLASQVVGATSGAVSTIMGTGKIGRSESPSFKIIPLNNTEISKQVISPIPNDVFYALYQQGYPLDLLMRVMVERIEIVAPRSKDEIVNSATRSSGRSYVNFLNTCAILREIQRAGHLDFVSTERLTVLGEYRAEPPPQAAKRQPIPVEDAAAVGDDGGLLPELDPDGMVIPPPDNRPDQPKPEQIIAARKDGYDYQLIDGKWMLGVWNKHPVFSIPTRSDKLAAQLRRNPALHGVDPAGIDRTLSILRSGLDVKTGGRDDRGESTRLVLRSYARVLEGVSGEQNQIAAFLQTYGGEVAPGQREPVIRTRWDGLENLEKPLVSVGYHSRRYAITDPKGSSSCRDAFRLLVALSSQVGVDISKFQNQFLEVR